MASSMIKWISTTHSRNITERNQPGFEVQQRFLEEVMMLKPILKGEQVSAHTAERPLSGPPS
jgi:hypothetical protein